jgi:DNA-binding PadR family transcriptional regulator
MKYPTKKEELLLLSVLRLKNEASLVSIRRLLSESTGENWSVGNVYVALDNLLRAGCLEAFIGEPRAKRGGKAVKYYRLTEEGFKALAEIKKIQDIMWQAFSVPVEES